MSPRRRVTRGRSVLAGALLVLALTGCGDDAPPSESAPALADRLDDVDTAIEAGKLDEARQAVEDLVADTAQAEVEGDISQDQADQILEAARELLAELPERGEP